MEIVKRKLSDLKMPDKNVRKHSNEQIVELQRSLEVFGQIRPVVIDEGNVILAGNGLFTALQNMGAKTANCYIAKGLSDIQKKKLMLADNRIFSLGEDDYNVIGEFLHEMGDDLDIPGYDDDFITLFLSSEISSDELLESQHPTNQHHHEAAHAEHMPRQHKEYTAVVQHDIETNNAPAICEVGQIWELGDHLLMCGDSTSQADVACIMEASTARMVFTDPPWNVNYGRRDHPQWKRRPIINDNLSNEDYTEFLNRWVKNILPYLTGDMYCVLGASEWPRLDLVLRAHGLHWSGTIIWMKDTFVMGRSNYHRRYEPIWYGWHNNSKSSFNGRRDLDDVWEIPRPKRSEEHPTMKPVELVARAIENSSKERETVLDPFGGSGTTLIACEQTNRRCRTIEISPHYCDVIIHRWQTLTGRTAARI